MESLLKRIDLYAGSVYAKFSSFCVGSSSDMLTGLYSKETRSFIAKFSYKAMAGGN